jgi:hypothetical protein
LLRRIATIPAAALVGLAELLIRENLSKPAGPLAPITNPNYAYKARTTTRIAKFTNHQPPATCPFLEKGIPVSANSSYPIFFAPNDETPALKNQGYCR